MISRNKAIKSTSQRSVGGGEKKSSKKDSKKSSKKDSKKSSKKDSKKSSKKESKKESKPKPDKLYCGVREPFPKPYTKYGSMKECAEKNQVKRYGRYKADSKKISTEDKKVKASKLKLYSQKGKLMGSVSRFKRILKNPKLTEKERQAIKDDANKIIREINALNLVIKKL